jgi:hypothetical protein
MRTQGMKAGFKGQVYGPSLRPRFKARVENPAAARQQDETRSTKGLR